MKDFCMMLFIMLIVVLTVFGILGPFWAVFLMLAVLAAVSTLALRLEDRVHTLEKRLEKLEEQRQSEEVER